MKSLLLLVEDNEDLLYNLKLTLEFNDYDVLTARNGLEAINMLRKTETLPDLIISDIMMPQMDGYELFRTVSKNPIWASIPFIFLTARTTPEDIRFGKMLGADDYLVKPFEEEDLLASVMGKIIRNTKIHSINKKVKELFSSLDIGISPVVEKKAELNVFLMLVGWNDRTGPFLQNHCPKETYFPISIDTIGFQLFSGATSIYGQDRIYEAQGFLLNIENIQSQGYIYFDSIPDPNSRGKQRPYMLGVISPNINYFQSLKINHVIRELSLKIKTNKKWDLQTYWEKINKILTAPIL